MWYEFAKLMLQSALHASSMLHAGLKVAEALGPNEFV